MGIDLRVLLAVILLALTGCAPSVAVRPSAPLTITHTQYVPIPAELLAPCPQPAPPIHTWGELAQAYLTVRAALRGCAAQVAGIAKTQVQHAGPRHAAT